MHEIRDSREIYIWLYKVTFVVSLKLIKVQANT
jgi:hypothetical protein